LVIEGRRYPNASGPGAGCHAKHGLCLDRGASPFTAEGVMRDADREGIDAMVFFPSAALGLPAFTDLAFAAECARLYNRWLAGYCRQFPQRMFGVGLVPIEDVATSIRIMREARELGLGALLLRPARRARGEARPPHTRMQARAARVPGARPALRELRARGERAALRRPGARGALRDVRERLPPLGQRLPELHPGAPRAH